MLQTCILLLLFSSLNGAWGTPSEIYEYFLQNYQNELSIMYNMKCDGVWVDIIANICTTYYPYYTEDDCLGMVKEMLICDISQESVRPKEIKTKSEAIKTFNDYCQAHYDELLRYLNKNELNKLIFESRKFIDKQFEVEIEKVEDNEKEKKVIVD